MKYKLFPPNEQDMRIEYPELAEVEEFKNLSMQDLKFIWFYGNRTSPYFYEEEKDKMRHSVESAYGRESYDENLNVIPPEYLQPAIEKMRHYNPSLRLIAKLKMEKLFDNLSGMMDMSVSDMEMENKKQYVEFAIKISQTFPEIIRQLESGFGIRMEEKEEKSEKKKPRLMDSIISNS